MIIQVNQQTYITNKLADSDAQIVNIYASEPFRYDSETDQFYKLSQTELKEIIYPHHQLILTDLTTGLVHNYQAINQNHFTIAELIRIIIDFDMDNRSLT